MTSQYYHYRGKDLENTLFYGIENLNDGFDAEEIYYFSAENFGKIIDRCEKEKIAIFGIESWIDGTEDGCEVNGQKEYSMYDADDPRWYRKAFDRLKADGEKKLYCATFGKRIQ